MPVINPGAGASSGPQRTTFRPPWVKDGPEPLPLPTAPWTLAPTRQKAPETQEAAPITPNLKPVPRKTSTAAENSTNSSGPSGASKTEPEPVRKTSKITIIPSRPSIDATPTENGHDASSKSTNSKSNTSKTQQAAKETKASKPKPEVKQIPIEIKSTTKPKQEQKQKSSTKQEEEKKKLNQTESKPPQPPAPPMPPPPPPPPGLAERKPISADKAEKIEALKSRPRKRPDWGALMKEVEGGSKRLKHVQSNDRSSPLLPKVKVKDKFMYESEKPNVHNQLLREIHSGINLKKVQTNDRSRPQLDGLRKFRRQMTIEEQIQKAETEETETEPDELDDIDKVRDDLQSTKQMLALELRNKEAMGRENKKLQTKILNLEVELEKERTSKVLAEGRTPQANREEDEQERRQLKKSLDDAQKSLDDVEKKYHDTISQLDMARADLEEALRKNQALERKLQISLLNQDRGSEQQQPLKKQPSAKKLAAIAAAKESIADMQQALAQHTKEEEEEEEEEYEEVTETETESSEEEEEDKEALQQRRTARELKLLATKLKSFKEKEETTRKERHSLRDQLKKQQKILKEEKKKYKVLQKEVDKMAKLMKDDEEESEDEEDEEEEEESEESESESESEESEEEESDGDLPPDAPPEKQKQNLTERSKRHENCLAALRKGNYLLKANIDRIKDELFKQKEMALSLQEDLNSVLAELG